MFVCASRAGPERAPCAPRTQPPPPSPPPSPQVQRFGPLSICIGGTVTFHWTGMHGVFQIPTIACPSNFTAGETDTYKYLAPSSNGGEFVWKTPNSTGHYWITSQFADDCRNGAELCPEHISLCRGVVVLPSVWRACLVRHTTEVSRCLPAWVHFAGMVAEVYVVAPEDEPFRAAALRASSRGVLLISAAAAAAALLLT